MLIIPRSEKQSIVIRDDIILEVVKIEGDEVRLSIEHPEGVSIRVGEVVAEEACAVEQTERG